MNCRFCEKEIDKSVVDLRVSPLANSYLPLERENSGEVFYPLHPYICTECFLVQLGEFSPAEDIFTEYAYFSSFSDGWLRHVKDYTDMAVSRYALNGDSLVVEVASNDGYLLQYFKEKNIPILGIEPAKNVAKTAIDKGIDTITEFFGEELAKKLKAQGKSASLLIGNNVLAHVPNLNDFVGGMKILLDKDGVITMEFPHLLNLIEKNQFDTIYHEHFSYLSLTTVAKVFAAHDLRIFDVETLPTHGGSIRIHACHDSATRENEPRVNEMLELERQRGLLEIKTYDDFALRVQGIRREVLSFLFDCKDKGLTVAAYGAPAKGNTLLNYCGVGRDLIEFTVDKNPYKQNSLLPGSRIPVYAVEELINRRPDIIVILPWNIKDEILSQLVPQCTWNPRYVTFVPGVKVITGNAAEV